MSEHVQTARLIAFFSILPMMFLIESLWSSRCWEVSRFKRLLFHLGLSAFNAVIYRLAAMAPLTVSPR